MKVTVAHIRGAKLCMGGAREWFDSHYPTHGMTWQEFLDNGADIEKVDALKDPLADRVAAFARQMEQNNG